MFTIGLLILLCKDNVLVLIDSHMGGQSAVWPGRPGNLKMRSVKLSWKFDTGGYIISFTQVKLTFPYICLWYLYVYICTGISLYILISWLFQMGSHWSHWKLQSWLSALAVLNGGRGIFPSLYILISWLFQMGSHWWHWTVKSWLSAMAVSNGGRGDISFLIYSY